MPQNSFQASHLLKLVSVCANIFTVKWSTNFLHSSNTKDEKYQLPTFFLILFLGKSSPLKTSLKILGTLRNDWKDKSFRSQWKTIIDSQNMCYPNFFILHIFTNNNHIIVSNTLEKLCGMAWWPNHPVWLLSQLCFPHCVASFTEITASLFFICFGNVCYIDAPEATFTDIHWGSVVFIWSGNPPPVSCLFEAILTN